MFGVVNRLDISILIVFVFDFNERRVGGKKDFAMQTSELDFAYDISFSGLLLSHCDSKVT